MENSKIAALHVATVTDEDCFIRLCNSPQQEERRRKRMVKDYRQKKFSRIARDMVVATTTLAALAVIASVL